MERPFHPSHAPRSVRHPLLATLVAWALLTGSGVALLGLNAARAQPQPPRPSLLTAMQAQDNARGFR